MSSQTLETILQTAIGREVEAYKFYKEAAEKVENSAVKEMFVELAGEEQKHEELLWKLKGDPTMSSKIEAPEDFKIAETIDDLPELSFEMKPADAIALAMKKEQQAADFYRQLAEIAGDAEVKDICQNLVNMELIHKNRLEKAFVDIGYPEVW